MHQLFAKKEPRTLGTIFPTPPKEHTTAVPRLLSFLDLLVCFLAFFASSSKAGSHAPENPALCMYVCMYVYIYIYIYLNLYMYECTYVCMHVCRNVCMYACMYVCTYVCMQRSQHAKSASVIEKHRGRAQGYMCFFIMSRHIFPPTPQHNPLSTDETHQNEVSYFLHAKTEK